ncbi:tail protein X [Motilimonas sp. 1_MG-2023]|uniref:tail protein X n=1 Tax=Motilimonas sp. 1_MG-2023 TaxID=3062672 RepID=UPI0026E3B3ED|nr:tail protein X [Motilimonas sp. 1_MG-2023]MDO6525446.1 tail protein X [Motilimonas sp. 1_MG-2023]
MKIRAQQGDTLDAICQRYYGRTAAVTEAVLEQNHGLAELGPMLPQGTIIELPDIAPPEQNNKMIQLWD